MTISRKMNENGYQKSADQCRDKAKKLRTTYRKIKDKHGKTGEGRKKWPFLEAMDLVLGDKPSTHPLVLVDTLREEEQQEVALEHEGSQDNSSQYASQEPSPSSNEENANINSGASTSVEDNLTPPVTPRNERQMRKRSREERLEKTMVEIVDRVLKAQEGSENKFAELEEKRMRLEEKMMESEERQRREDREFQARMWMMLFQGGQANCFSPQYRSTPMPPSSGAN